MPVSSGHRKDMWTAVKTCCKYGPEVPPRRRTSDASEEFVNDFGQKPFSFRVRGSERKRHRVSVINGDPYFYLTLSHDYRFHGDVYVNLEKRGSEKCDSVL